MNIFFTECCCNGLLNCVPFTYQNSFGVQVYTCVIGTVDVWLWQHFSNNYVLHDENLSLGQLIPQFRKSDFPLICQSIRCGPGESPLSPQTDTHQLFVDHDCVTPQLLLSLRLGLWPSQSGTSEIVAKRGAESFGDFLKRDSSNWGVRPQSLCVSNGGNLLINERFS